MAKTIQCPRCGSLHFERTKPYTGQCKNCGETFAVPMRVFLSYGHPESEICRRIYEALEADPRFDPWFDEEKLHFDSDWRVRIQEGVKESQTVVACLSPHSTRPRGVCLDELAIAVGVKGGNIHSVLLAPEKTLQPPAMAAHKQWLRMEDWQEKKQAGPEVFEPWFQAKMQQLMAVLDSPETRRFEGELDTIRQRLEVLSDSSKEAGLLRKVFIGRTWVEQKLKNWMTDPNGRRMCLLYGGPGVGKSAFAVHYTNYHPHVAAFLSCESDMPTFNDPRVVIQTLCYQLACRLPQFRENLVNLYLPENKATLATWNEKELFSYLIQKPLQYSVDGGHETMAIVLDGLDECGSPEKNVLARTLAVYAEALPDWLRLLVVARPTPAVLQYAGNALQIELKGEEAENLEDIRCYYTYRLAGTFGGDPQWPASLEALTEKSQGAFLYAEMMAGLLLDRGTLLAVEEYPVGLNAVFMKWFDHFFPSREEYRSFWRKPIGCLLGAPAPLPESELCKAMDWDEDDLADFRHRISVLLREDKNAFGDSTLQIDHAFVRAWLTQRENPYSASPDAGAKRLAKTFYARFEENPEELSFYEAVYLPELLEQAEMKKEYQVVVQSENWLWRAMNAGKHCETWGKLSESLAVYGKCRTVVEKMMINRGTSSDKRNLSVIYEMIADVYTSKNNLKEALTLYQRSIAISETLLTEQKLVEDKRRVSMGYIKEANIYQQQGRMEKATDLNQKGASICEVLVAAYGKLGDKRNLSVSYGNIAYIYQRQGRLEEALELYRKSVAINESLVTEYGRILDKQNLSISYNGMAKICQLQGHLEKALMLYQKSIAINEEQMEKYRTPDDKSRLSVNYTGLADIYEAQEQWDKALLLYQKSCKIDEELVRERKIPDDMRGLLASYDRMANIYQLQNNLKKAIPLYQKSAKITEKLVEEFGMPDDKRDLALSYARMADICQSQGQVDEALRLYKKNIELCEELLTERDIPEDKRELMVSYSEVAQIYKSQERFDEALRLYQKGLAISEELVAERGIPEDQRDLCVGYGRIANIYKLQEQFDKALILYQKSLVMREKLVTERGIPEDKRSLAAGYNDVASAYEMQGHPKEAIVMIQKGLSIYEALVEEYGKPGDKRNLVIRYSEIADFYESQNRVGEALELYQKSLVISEQLVAECGTSEDERGLSVTCDRIADICCTQGQWDKALPLYQKSLTVSEKLALEHGTTEDKRDLAMSYHNVADICYAQGRVEEAIELYRKGLAIQEMIVAEDETPGDRGDLSEKYAKIADICELQKDYRNALKWYQKAVTLIKKLIKECECEEDVRTLVKLYRKMADCVPQNSAKRQMLLNKSKKVLRKRL